jgi:hypothetical protein
MLHWMSWLAGLVMVESMLLMIFNYRCLLESSPEFPSGQRLIISPLEDDLKPLPIFPTFVG